MINKEIISNYFQFLQNKICKALKEADEAGKFGEDLWQRAEGGGGRTRIIQDGNVIEKGGVLFSAVFGEMPAVLIEKKNFEKGEFYATGISIVIHPQNPYMPIIHMNLRYFEMSQARAWFGGGIDLSPHYINKEDAKFFHQKLKETCDLHHPNYYPEFKKWADNYFYIPHRKETRGIGGIFFDRLSTSQELSLEQRFEFVRSVGEAFIPIYASLIQKNKDLPFGEREIQWQQIRRGRYVEFNLLYDQGTKFGLETNGRTESILMSLPKQASWFYDFKPEKGSPEEQTLLLLKKDMDWIDLIRECEN